MMSSSPAISLAPARFFAGEEVEFCVFVRRMRLLLRSLENQQQNEVTSRHLFVARSEIALIPAHTHKHARLEIEIAIARAKALASA